MKKISMVVIALMLMSGVAFSQAQVAIGLKGGVNISKFDESASDNITSFHGGAFALVKLTKIGIQPEILFSQQGSKFSDINSDELKTSYLSIPVMLKIYLAAGINIQAGPQFGFLTAAEFDGNDVKDSFKSSDISANVGLGWDLPFGLTIDARYNIGLQDVSEDTSISSEALKSRVIQISVGYKIFKLGN
jgi:hypothetical protein